jgi:hypothetical protein
LGAYRIPSETGLLIPSRLLLFKNIRLKTPESSQLAGCGQALRNHFTDRAFFGAAMWQLNLVLIQFQDNRWAVIDGERY